jgi:hypothetical protein
MRTSDLLDVVYGAAATDDPLTVSLRRSGN